MNAEIPAQDADESVKTVNASESTVKKPSKPRAKKSAVKDEVITLTPIQADYLAIIWNENQVRGYARGCNVANSAKVTRSTVTATMRSLRAAGLIDYQPYSPIQLTDKGRKWGAIIHRQRLVVNDFLECVLALDEEKKTNLGAVMQSALNEEALSRLERLTAFAKKNETEWVKGGE